VAVVIRLVSFKKEGELMEVVVGVGESGASENGGGRQLSLQFYGRRKISQSALKLTDQEEEEIRRLENAVLLFLRKKARPP
jgi:hypothetical protein